VEQTPRRKNFQEVKQRKMIRIVAFLALLIRFASPAVATGIDEVYVRPGNGWGIDTFQKLFNKSEFGKSYAIVIGIEKYENYESLDAPGHDAVKFRDFLENEARFDYVVTLTEEKATKERIEILMEQTVPNMIKPGDRVLFYFSGHGATRQLPNDKKRGYLILGNSGKGAWDSMIDMPRLMEWAQNVDAAQHVLFVIDACFSGLAAYQVKGTDITAQTLERLSQPAHHIVTAGVEDEKSYAFNGESIFTSEFLAAARGQLGSPSDGVISLSEIMSSVGRAIDRRRAELGEKIKMSPHMYQTRLEEESGEFFFLTKPKMQAPSANSTGPVAVEREGGESGAVLKGVVSPKGPIDTSAEPAGAERANRALASETDRIATLEDDIRERAFFKRRLKGERFMDRRAAEIEIWRVEESQLKGLSEHLAAERAEAEQASAEKAALTSVDHPTPPPSNTTTPDAASVTSEPSPPVTAVPATSETQTLTPSEAPTKPQRRPAVFKRSAAIPKSRAPSHCFVFNGERFCN
jgi:caspase domain-containing protein